MTKINRNCLIGYTGFVGSNLIKQQRFDAYYNSRTIEAIKGKSFDQVVCAGIQPIKWWANKHPEADRTNIDNLMQQLRQCHAGHFIMISTIDVYPDTQQMDEQSDCHSRTKDDFAKNRLYAEDQVKQLFPNVTIIRLPSLFGHGLKTNALYNLQHDHALETVHPDSRFQWYNLEHLWLDIQSILNHNIKLVNLVTEPIDTSILVERFFPGKKIGTSAGSPLHYDIRSTYADKLGGSHGYLYPKARMLREMGDFLKNCKRS